MNEEVKETAQQGEGVDPNPNQDAPVDPWAEAFAAVEREKQENAPGDVVDSAGDGQAEPARPDAPSAEGLGASEEGQPAQGDLDVGTGDGGGEPALVSEVDSDNSSGYSEDEINAQIEGWESSIQEQAIQEVAQAMLEKGVKNTNGVLGASINDPDIRKVNADGTVSYYNPETGNQFTGDNPKSQARQWVNEYNDDLKETFNKVVSKRMGQLQETIRPQVEFAKFIPTYEKLDPIRREMFESIVEDYEVRDTQGQHIGYSIDLNIALKQVNRQIERIQASQAHTSGGASSESLVPPAPSSPAADMPAGAGSQSSPRVPKSQAEAMEMEQDKILAQLRAKDEKRKKK